MKLVTAVLKIAAVVFAGTLMAWVLALLFGVQGGPKGRESLWIGTYWWPMFIALFYTIYRMGCRSAQHRL